MPRAPHVKAARYGNRLEVTKYEKPLILGTAPLVFYRRKRSDLTYKSQANIWRVQRRIRQYVGVLTQSEGDPAFATFTYTKKQYDVHQAIEDWRLFTRRVKRHFPDVAFIRVPERHKDGGVHFHAAMFGLPHDLPCIMVKVNKRWVHNCEKSRKCERKLRLLAAAWDRGFVDLQKVRDVEAIGRYVAKYLTKGDPDWTLFGNHVATSNQIFRKKIIAARNRGILWELSSHTSPVGLSFALDDALPRAHMRSVRTFETKWLGMAHHEVYDLDTSTETYPQKIFDPPKGGV